MKADITVTEWGTGDVVHTETFEAETQQDAERRATTLWNERYCTSDRYELILKTPEAVTQLGGYSWDDDEDD